ncbi:hypothetical protein RFI_22189 [Reticulomyxa filosa]|uniref:Uncharacterized protein n=1 Tax=Reticulomyxa filosa TaxID=46433 RepID=X6MMS6_RETFI|nr:hypothetical protein RFI_22189 [Reticulomyxa filosa]|eukprot:ETO15174.1 hypothetical protein RFI_22189 [Reticulomyxa filosa]
MQVGHADGKDTLVEMLQLLCGEYRSTLYFKGFQLYEAVKDNPEGLTGPSQLQKSITTINCTNITIIIIMIIVMIMTMMFEIDVGHRNLHLLTYVIQKQVDDKLAQDIAQLDSSDKKEKNKNKNKNDKDNHQQTLNATRENEIAKRKKGDDMTGQGWSYYCANGEYRIITNTGTDVSLQKLHVGSKAELTVVPPSLALLQFFLLPREMALSLTFGPLLYTRFIQFPNQYCVLFEMSSYVGFVLSYLKSKLIFLHFCAIFIEQSCFLDAFKNLFRQKNFKKRTLRKFLRNKRFIHPKFQSIQFKKKSIA